HRVAVGAGSADRTRWRRRVARAVHPAAHETVAAARGRPAPALVAAADGSGRRPGRGGRAASRLGSLPHAGVVSEALRVALVPPYSWPEVRRGGELYLADLAWYLHGAGHHVDVVTGSTGTTTGEVVEGVPYHRYRHRLPPPLAARGMTTDETFGLAAF